MAALFSAVFITSLFVMIYYYQGVLTDDLTGAADYKWRSRQYKANAAEGFAWMRMDKNGFNNVTVSDRNMDILVMGASHMEAAQVPQDKNTCSLLNKEMDGIHVYNIGIAGHSIMMCIDNLEDAIKTYHPKDYVIIHTDDLLLDSEGWGLLADGNFAEVEFMQPGKLRQLREIPSLKIIYKQLVDKVKIERANSKAVSLGGDADKEPEFEMIHSVLKKVSDLAGKYEIHIMIAYTPHVGINKDASIYRKDEVNQVNQFASLCLGNGIIFADFYKEFERGYYDNYKLPFGFMNASIINGHLNRQGHQIVAREIQKIIKKGNK